jgi:hypothetical protein
MAKVSVDNQASLLDAAADQRLGDIVQAVISKLPPNRIVREIVLDGRELPKYQEASALEHALGEVKDLQIRTADREIWAANGFDIALSCVERVQKSLIRAAELFREDDIAEANQFFSHCVEGLERFLETITITRSALKLDFSRIQIHGISLKQVENEFSSIFSSILAYQEKQDYIGIADKVEYELLTNLCSWAGALKQLRLSAHSNA